MGESKRLDVSRALAIAGVFHFLHSAAKSCVMPFLPIYFRHLGLTPPLVGIVMGMKHLICVLWAPLCSYFAKSHRRRRILMCTSLLLSVGAGMLLTLIPPLHKEIVHRLCNVSLHSGDRLTMAGFLDIKYMSPLNTSRHLSLPTSQEATSSSSFPPVASSASSENDPAAKTPLAAASTWRKAVTEGNGGRTGNYTPPALAASSTWKKAVTEGNGGRTGNYTPPALEASSTWKNAITDGDGGRTGNYTEPVHTGLDTILEGISKKLQDESLIEDPESTLAEKPEFHALDANGTHQSVFNDSAEYVFSGNGGVTQVSPVGPGALGSPPNTSKHLKKVRDVNFEVLQGTSFFNPEHTTFLMVFGAVVLWELLAAPLEWTADDSLYEYLDFVDATDRHGRLWIWGYLGISLGACSVATLVDNLRCFLSPNIPRMVVHFYGYAALLTASLLVSIFYPIHVSKKTEHSNKTVKALGLIGNDGRMLLMAVTVFLTGAVISTANNFLFWQMQDIGSTELYMGISIAIALLSEILLFAFKNKLFKVFSGSWAVALSLSCLAIQLLYYSFLWTPWAVLPIQILSAFSNGALWWVANSLADDVATPGTERSLQMVLHSLSYGCGSSLGSFSSGFIVHNFSLDVLYRACSITLMLWLALFLIVQSKLPRQRKINYSRLLAADVSDLSDSDDDQERDWLVKAMKDENTIKKR